MKILALYALIGLIMINNSLQDCNTKEVLIGETCTNCCSLSQVLYQAQCVDQSTLGVGEIVDIDFCEFKTCADLLKKERNGICCLPGYINDSGVCTACQDPNVLINNNVCVSSCNPNLTEDGDCVTQCSSEKLTQEGVCVAECDQLHSKYTNECLSECPVGFISSSKVCVACVYQFNVCTIQCLSGYVSDQSICKLCSDMNMVNQRGVCQQSCSAGYVPASGICKKFRVSPPPNRIKNSL